MTTPPSRIVWPSYPLSQDPLPKHVQRYPGAIAGEELKVRLVFMHQKPFHVTTTATPAYCPTDAELNVIATKYPGMTPDGPEWIRIKSDLILAGEDAMQMERWPASVVISKIQPATARGNSPRATIARTLAATTYAGLKPTEITRAVKLFFGGDTNGIEAENDERGSLLFKDSVERFVQRKAELLKAKAAGTKSATVANDNEDEEPDEIEVDRVMKATEKEQEKRRKLR